MKLNSLLEEIKISFIESWEQFIEQVPNIVASIAILLIGIIFSNVLSKLFKKAIDKKADDPLMVSFLTKTVRIGLILIVIMFALKVAGLGGIATSILATAGASAIIIGFAFKDIGENFISGIILTFKRPFKINDTVSIGDIFGKVKSMEFRYTKVKTFDGKDVYIPNSDIIRKAVFNYTEDGYFRLDFTVGIAYEDDNEYAQKIILDTLRKSENVFEDSTHETFVIVDELGVNTVNLKVYFWVETMEYRKMAYQIKGDVISEVKNNLMAQNINMPANINELKLYHKQPDIPLTMKDAR